MNYLVVFVTNTTILVFEIVGGRLLAPYLGTSVEVWAGTIAVILGGMAVGYWVGGVLADRHPSGRIVPLILFMSGLAALLAWSTRDLIPSLFATSHTLPLTFTAMLIAALLFMPTTIILAAVSPFVAKALIVKLDSSARVVGRLNAVGTVGSIVGAIATGSLLIPYIGISTILLGIAIVLLALALVTGSDHLKTKVVFVLLIGGVAALFNLVPVRADSALADVSTTYNRIWIDHLSYRGENVKIIQTDPYGIQCGMAERADGSLDDTKVPFPHQKAFNALTKVLIPEPTNALFLGGCNYSHPRQFLNAHPDNPATVVELDPGMTKIAEDYFDFDPTDFPSLSIVHEDARRFLNAPGDTYDVIYMDVFGSYSNTPTQLTTKETFAAIANHVSDSGVLMINLIGTTIGPGTEFPASLLATAQTAFAHTAIYTTGASYRGVPETLILVASKDTTLPETLHDPKQPEIPLTNVSKELQNGVVLTDDYAPVEHMTEPYRAASY